MRIGPAANVARINVAEIITALWSFANAQGLLTDDITERTGGAGVTIGGVRFDNIAIDLLGLASAANRVLGSDVIGDVDERFRLHAGGIMQWGDGTGARDTQLQRDAANELGTPDDFNVGGVLDLGGDLEYDESDIVLAAGANNNVATGVIPHHQIFTAGGVATVSGFAGSRDNRQISLFNSGPDDITLLHLAAGSLAANRMELPNNASQILRDGDGCILYKSPQRTVWVMIGTTVGS